MEWQRGSFGGVVHRGEDEDGNENAKCFKTTLGCCATILHSDGIQYR